MLCLCVNLLFHVMLVLAPNMHSNNEYCEVVTLNFPCVPATEFLHLQSSDPVVWKLLLMSGAQLPASAVNAPSLPHQQQSGARSVQHLHAAAWLRRKLSAGRDSPLQPPSGESSHPDWLFGRPRSAEIRCYARGEAAFQMLLVFACQVPSCCIKASVQSGISSPRARENGFKGWSSNL